jgi:LacI family transcriptional regulator
MPVVCDRSPPVRAKTAAELNFAAVRHAGEQIAMMPDGIRPTAAFCANDLVAIGVLQEMTRRSLGVPGDLAIVG